jgi:hypothetical protein
MYKDLPNSPEVYILTNPKSNIDELQMLPLSPRLLHAVVFYPKPFLYIHLGEHVLALGTFQSVRLCRLRSDDQLHGSSRIATQNGRSNACHKSSLLAKGPRCRRLQSGITDSKAAASLDHCSNHTAILPLRKPAAPYRYVLSRVTYR